MRHRRRTHLAKQYISFFMGQQYAKLVLGIAAAVILGIIAILIVDATRAPTVKDTAAYQNGVVTVGLVTGTPLCQMTESGEFTGYEAEVAQEIISRVFGDSVAVKYVEVTDQMVAYALKVDQIDVAFGMMTKDVTKTLGLDVGTPYFYDPVYLYVTEGNKNMPLTNLTGRRTLVMVSDMTKSGIETALEELQITDTELISSSSYSDAAESVQLGLSTGVFASYYKMTGTELYPIPDVVTYVPYSPIVWRESDPIYELINAEIERMDNEGYFTELMEKWSLL